MKWKGRLFSSGQAKIYPLNYLLHMGIKLTIIKVFTILRYSYSASEDRENPGNFQTKSVNPPFNCISRYIFSLPKQQGKEKPFLKGWKERNHIVRLSPVVLGCHKIWKNLSFVKFEIILPILYFLLDPLTNKHCKKWSPITNLWRDSRQGSTIIIKLPYLISYVCQSFGVRHVRGQIPKNIHLAPYLLPNDFPNNFSWARSYLNRMKGC